MDESSPWRIILGGTGYRAKILEGEISTAVLQAGEFLAIADAASCLGLCVLECVCVYVRETFIRSP